MANWWDNVQPYEGQVGPLPPPNLPSPAERVCAQCGQQPAAWLTNDYTPLCRYHGYLHDGASEAQARRWSRQHRQERLDDLPTGKPGGGKRQTRSKTANEAAHG